MDRIELNSGNKTLGFEKEKLLREVCTCVDSMFFFTAVERVRSAPAANLCRTSR